MRSALGMLAAFALLVLALEPACFGLPPGHHGWVTSQHLAIVRNAHAGNRFVGYTGLFEERPGELHHFYFDRAPFAFEALAHALLRPFEDRTQRYLHLARQLMNGVFVLTLFVCFRFLCLLLGDPRRAGVTALAACSGHYFLHYKNLFEQNRLGALAVVLVLYGSARLLLAGDRRRFWWAVLPASCMGEAAPAAFALLALNALLFAARAESGGSSRSPAAHLRSPAFAALCASGLIYAGWIAYNVSVESAIRGVPAAQTELVDSALRRLGVVRDSPGAGEFLAGQWRAIRRGVVPEALYQLAHLDTRDEPLRVWVERAAKAASIALWLAGGLACARWLARERGARRLLIGLALLSGPAYLLPMRRLAHYHDFIATYWIGLDLVFWAALLGAGWGGRGAGRLRELAVAAVAALSLLCARQQLASRTPDWPRLAAEVDRARSLVGRERPRLYAPEGWRDFLEGVPYALSFFFPDSIVTSRVEGADYVVTRRARQAGEDLLPGNSRVRVYAP